MRSVQIVPEVSASILNLLPRILHVQKFGYPCKVSNSTHCPHQIWRSPLSDGSSDAAAHPSQDECQKLAAHVTAVVDKIEVDAASYTSRDAVDFLERIGRYDHSTIKSPSIPLMNHFLTI
jgi:hypothetical protein